MVSMYTRKILFTLGISISLSSRGDSVQLAMPKRSPGWESLFKSRDLKGPCSRSLERKGVIGVMSLLFNFDALLLMRCSSECLWLLGLFQGSSVSVCFCLQTEHRCPVTSGLDRRLNVYSFEKQDQGALVQLLGYRNNTFFMVKIYIHFLGCRNTIL